MRHVNRDPCKSKKETYINQKRPTKIERELSMRPLKTMSCVMSIDNYIKKKKQSKKPVRHSYHTSRENYARDLKKRPMKYAR